MNATTTDAEAPRLIEVALPVMEISAESVRDKSIRHGHISTLHLWWARRPLPVCRAVVFASLVPDPDHAGCPEAFRTAVTQLLGQKNGVDPYEPYSNIPTTAVVDPMGDTPRNRLLMFIGRFSDEFIENERLGKSTSAKDKLSPFSLIKWESKNKESILNIARKLIWVAHDPERNTIEAFDNLWPAIINAEHALHSLEDRHEDRPEVQEKEAALQAAIEAFQNRMPAVFDPFAGGGAIPLEAARLGCRSYGNDLNPVAHIIQRGSVEFPQKFGKPIAYSKEAFEDLYGTDAWQHVDNDWKRHRESQLTGVRLPNRLAWDVEHYAHELLRRVRAEIGHYYPPGPDGKTPIAYYWARTATCSNPSCRAEVPLLKQFYLVNKDNKKVHLHPIIEGNHIRFDIRQGETDQEGWNYRGNMTCPCCGQTTPVKLIKEQSVDGGLNHKLLAVIEQGDSGKAYRLPTDEDIQSLDNLPLQELENYRPTEDMQRNSAGGDTFGWGISQWGQMFPPRQLLALQTFVQQFHALKDELPETDYNKAVLTYLGIWLDRLAIVGTSFSRWNTVGEKVEHTFARQAIPMIFDFPEANPFSNSTGSANNMLNWIVRYIMSEAGTYFLPAEIINAASGEIGQYPAKFFSATVTDPPYYDAMAYADLSDFFYVWLKRTVGSLYPENFAFPQTPKTEECTALKHHHANNAETAKAHFEEKLRQIFAAIEQQTDGVVSIMFAHQSTEAWGTLCNSILGSDMNITGSWALDTERSARSVALAGAALASSVTVSARPVTKAETGDYKTVEREIQTRVREQVKYLYGMGFRGADLLTACFGQAVSVFGEFEHVEKGNGTPVTVADLLELARDTAFDAIVTDLEADDHTRFYIGWLNLFGFAAAEHDDVRQMTQVGLNLDVGDLQNRAILTEEKKQKHRLAGYAERLQKKPQLGDTASDTDAPPMLDQLHRAMHLFEQGDTTTLAAFLGEVAPEHEHPFWRVLTALGEVLPPDSADHEQVKGLLATQDSLLKQSRRQQREEGEQTAMKY